MILDVHRSHFLREYIMSTNCKVYTNLLSDVKYSRPTFFERLRVHEPLEEE